MSPHLLKLGAQSLLCTRLSAGEAHSLAIDAEGGLLAFGSNALGQLGYASHKGVCCCVPRHVEGLDGKVFLHASAASSHSAAVTVDGELFVFGKGSEGQIGNGSLGVEFAPVLVEASAQLA